MRRSPPGESRRRLHRSVLGRTLFLPSAIGRARNSRRKRVRRLQSGTREDSNSLAESDYTGVAWRLRHPESVKSPVEDPSETGDSTVAVNESPSEQRSGPRLRLVVGACRGVWLDISEQHYFELVSWTAQLPIREATTEANANDIAVTKTLAAIGCNPGEWQEQLAAIRLGTRVAGGCAKVRAWAEKHGQRWIRRGRGRGATGRPITSGPHG